MPPSGVKHALSCLCLHNLQNLTRFKSGTGQENHRTGHVAGFHTNHVWVFVVAEVAHVLGFFNPWVPDDSVGEVVLLYAHLTPGYYVGYDVFVWGVLIHAVGPFADCHDVAAFLIDSAIARLVDERAAVQAGDLTSADVRNFEVSVEKHVETEC